MVKLVFKCLTVYGQKQTPARAGKLAGKMRAAKEA